MFLPRIYYTKYTSKFKFLSQIYNLYLCCSSCSNRHLLSPDRCFTQFGATVCDIASFVSKCVQGLIGGFCGYVLLGWFWLWFKHKLLKMKIKLFLYTKYKWRYRTLTPYSTSCGRYTARLKFLRGNVQTKFATPEFDEEFWFMLKPNPKRKKMSF